MMVKATAYLIATLALGAAMPAYAAAQAGPQAVAQNPAQGQTTRLDLQARGVVRAVPDLAIISAGVVTQAPTAEAAMRANAERMSRIFKALRAAGVADKSIRTQSVALSPQYRYADNTPPMITGYQASNTVSVQFREIAKSGAILDTLVAQGANEISGPNFIVEQRAAAEDQARQDALRTLRSRAALYAAALGLKVRRIVSLSETSEAGAPPMPFLMARAAVADAAQPKTDIAPGEQDVAVTVSAVFELD